MTTSTQPATDVVVDARLEDVEDDPYPLYRRMRREAPIAWVPETERLWITPYELCREAGDNDQVFGPTQDVFHLVYGDPNVMSLMGDEHKESRAPLDAPPAIAGTSRLTAAVYAYCPTPGQEKIFSTSTAPVRTFAKTSPMTVMTDGSAARRMYRLTTTRSGRPFARAART